MSLLFPYLMSNRSLQGINSLASLICLALALGGCSFPFVEAYTTSEKYSPARTFRTFAVVLTKEQDTVIDRKIGSLLEHQMKLLGYDKMEPDSADLHVMFSKDVAASGKLFVKALNVRLVDRKSTLYTGKEVVVWEAHTEEKGWCNQILITAPHIIAAMFENFDASVVHQAKHMKKEDELALGVMGSRPYELNCGSPPLDLIAPSSGGSTRMEAICIHGTGMTQCF